MFPTRALCPAYWDRTPTQSVRTPSVLRHACVKRTGKKTNTAVSLLANELVLERGIWRYVYRRSPDGIVNRIERYLRGRNHQSRYTHRRTQDVRRWMCPSYRVAARFPRQRCSVFGGQQDEQRTDRRRKRKIAHLAIIGRRALIEHHRHLLRRLRCARPDAELANVHRDCLPWSNGDYQAAITTDSKTARATC